MIDKSHILEIDKAKKYVIFLNEHSATEAELQRVRKEFQSIGVYNIVLVVGTQQVKVTEE